MRIFITLLILSISLYSCKSAEEILGVNNRTYYVPQYLKQPSIKDLQPTNKTTKPISIVKESDIILKKFKQAKKIDKLLNNAKSYLGVPYRYGGTTRRGIDCSAFTQQVFKSQDINIPRTSIYQAQKGKKIKLKEAQEGDLLFFATAGKGHISHVGIVYEVKGEDIYFIHAASSKGVSIAPLSNSYWNKRFLMARRIIGNS